MVCKVAGLERLPIMGSLYTPHPKNSTNSTGLTRIYKQFIDSVPMNHIKTLSAATLNTAWMTYE
jgi:hypothetical protein